MNEPDRVRRRESHLTKEAERVLCVAAQNGDREARKEIGEAHYGFVAQLAKRYSGYVASQGELIQAGYIGLMESVDKYDPDRGTRLLTLAFWAIRRHMLDLVKVNRSATRDVSLDAPEITGRVGVLPVGTSHTSDEDGPSMGSRFVDASAADPSEEAELSEMAGLIAQKVQTLKPRVRKIVEMRVGVGASENKGAHTFVEIGQRFKISAERARRIYVTAINRIREELGGV